MTEQLPASIGVYGGGRMGAGIAHAFLITGCEVTVVERDGPAADAARERLVASVTKAVERGSTDASVDDLLARLSLGTGVEALRGAGLVIEAVPEEIGLKIDVLTAVEREAPGAVLATNTSALSIDTIAASLDDPSRLIGLHFFNPVPVSELVEIVRGAATPDELVDSAVGWVGALGKTPVVVTDSPGFATSRLGVAIALEAIRMVEEGVASAADIDKAMTLGYRHPMGPLETTDIVGLDVRLTIAEGLAATLGDRFAPPQLLRDLVAQGHFGRKTGQGFYAW